MSRIRIGLCIDYLGSAYHKAVYNGIESACIENDVNLATYVTGRIGSNLEIEKCRNNVLPLLPTQNIHGIIFAAASVFNLLDAGEKESLLQNFGDMPISILGDVQISGEMIRVKSRENLHPLVEHLVEFHGYKKIAFIGGPRDNGEAMARKKSILESLQNYNIKIKKKWIIEGDFRAETGRFGIRKLISENDLPQAIICANDSMAWGVMAELREAGIAPGMDIAVTGYDDLTTSNLLGLTTLGQMHEKKAFEACQLLIQKIQGRPFEDFKIIDEELKIRSSCGCKNLSNFDPPQIKDKSQKFVQNTMSDLLRIQSLWADDPFHLRQKIEEKMASLHILEIENQKEIISHIEPLAKEILKNLESLATIGHELKMDEINDKMEKIASCLDLPSLFQTLNEEIPSIKISNLHLILSSKVEILADRFTLYQTDFDKKPISNDIIIPKDFFEKPDRQSFIVHVLFHGFEQLGLAVFGSGARDVSFYEYVRSRISLSIKTSTLVGALKEYAQDLEGMVEDRTKELHTELENRKRVELELRRSEQHIRELANSVPGIVIETDSRFFVNFVNQAGVQVLGCPVPNDNHNYFQLFDYLSENSRTETKELFKGILNHSGNDALQTELKIIPHKNPEKTNVLLVTVRARGPIGGERGLYLSAIDINPLLDSAVAPDAAFYEHFHLSPRVREVFDLMVRGLNIEDIGLELGISINTVKVHIHTIYIATGVKNRRELFTLLQDYQKREFGYGSLLHSMIAGVVSSKKTKN